jgi:hypothetical protein
MAEVINFFLDLSGASVWMEYGEEGYTFVNFVLLKVHVTIALGIFAAVMNVFKGIIVELLRARSL